ncbi:MAG: hypothetical protein K0Q53_1269 [Massilibacillus sp.]|jgi:uncharacterized membrane protein YgaE (UPF0421/DUF939 family)|nr:hypothetical protein [Massilibacillus sp.]
MNFIGYRTLKTALGVVIAMYIASALGLKDATSAGIITILSLQNTRKQSIQLAIKMLCAFLLALFLSVILFKLYSYTPFIFGIFLLFFISIAVRLKLQEGIVISAVLITHLLIEQDIQIPFLLNQLYLMIIGVAIALILNLFMPNLENKFKEKQQFIENIISSILLNMSESLRNQTCSIGENNLFTQLRRTLKEGSDIAHINYNNRIFATNNNHRQYMEIREQQLNCLLNMKKHFDRLSTTYRQTIIIADFANKVAYSISDYTMTNNQLTELRNLRDSFTTMPLPQDRAEFENRSVLYQFLNDMDELLLLENILKNL